MLKQDLSSPSAAGSDAVTLQRRRRDALARGNPDDVSEDTVALAQTVRDQLAREIADIETATAVLRKGEPGLESWTKSPAQTIRKPRPVWLIIGVLWLSTAIVTAGAVVAIATFAG
jgi:hypothetical protein